MRCGFRLRATARASCHWQAANAGGEEDGARRSLVPAIFFVKLDVALSESKGFGEERYATN